jgi:nitrate/TMAO reductase-like tetraheme cytochrome c subunit
MKVIRKSARLFLLCGSLMVLLIVGLTTHVVRAQESPDQFTLPVDHLLFTTSTHCIACHSQVHAPDGEDISIGYQWRASIMANSARDPYWQASIRRETMDHPTATGAIEDKCATCHMPMQRFQARAEGLRGQVFKYLASVSDGSAMEEPEGELEDAKDVKAALAADGVGCTLCHQIQPGNLGKPSSLDGGFLINTAKKPEEREVFGPYDDPDKGRQRIMHSSTAFLPARGDHIKASELCATCHTLLTDALDEQGKPAGTLPEQMPFQEWQHSAYVKTDSCQSCHMTQAPDQSPITSVHAELHDGVMRHIFVGGNAFMLRILKDHGSELGVIATPAELEASAQRSEKLLSEQTASVSISKVHVAGARLAFEVRVSNKAGHKLPTGYPARRAWLHVSVRDAQGNIVFESGALKRDGSITGNDNDEDAGKFEQHYDRITDAGQVQIYESIMGDSKERVTTGLLYGNHYLKDNRLLPRGFDKNSADPQIAVIGAARQDPGFAGGEDTLTYDVVTIGTPHSVTAELLYESIGYRWADNLRAYQAREPQRFLGYFQEQAHLAGKVLARASDVFK